MKFDCKVCSYMVKYTLLKLQKKFEYWLVVYNKILSVKLFSAMFQSKLFSKVTQ